MNPTGRDFLNDLWRDTCGLPPAEQRDLPSLESLKHSEWCESFEKAMRDRLIMGAFRYGLIREQDYSRYDLVSEVKRRVDRYRRTRNLEYLVDAANMCLLAFIHGRRQGEQLSSIDDGEHTPRKVS